MKFDKYCLDTHVLAWYFLDKKTLSSKAKEITRKIFKGEARGYISVMVILETYYISLKDEKFNFVRFAKSLDDSNIKIVPFDGEILEEALRLSDGIDIHDRIIVATAVVTGSQLVSKDEKIRSAFPLKTVW